MRRLFATRAGEMGLQAALARAVGVTAQSAGDWAKGSTAPRPEHWAAIEDFFGCERGHLRQLVIDAGDTPNGILKLNPDVRVAADFIAQIAKQLQDLNAAVNELRVEVRELRKPPNAPGRGGPQGRRV